MGKQILVIGFDGIGDRPSKELNGMTPLEAASKPTIDWLASRGAQGIMDPIAPGVIPGSDTAHLAIFGLDPFKVYPGRGPFEAIGAGAVLEPGDIALRGNFASVDSNLVVIDRRAGRSEYGLDELVRFLSKNIIEIDGVEVRFYRATEHRVAIVLRGRGLSDKVSDTDPHVEGQRISISKPLNDSEEARRTAEIINKLSIEIHNMLKNHEINRERVEKGLPPANVILMRGAGKMPHLKKIWELDRIEIKKAAAISGTALIKGVTKILGFEVIHPQGATGGLNTNVASKVRAARDMLDKGYDLVYLHFKGTDSASHDRKPREKKEFIERCDEALSQLIPEFADSIVIAITGDHTTSSELGQHTSDPVPLLIYSKDMFYDALGKFSERSARAGVIGRIRGSDLIYMLSDLAGRQEKFGA
ncbi:MAG: 2,3-bisphosphoglycerate-independent phosphoglycerate mutase [Sulfolobales archaeon]